MHCQCGYIYFQRWVFPAETTLIYRVLRETDLYTIKDNEKCIAEEQTKLLL